MAATAPASTLRKQLHQRFSEISAEFETLLETELAERVSTARRDCCERFNQALRRLRQAGDFSAVAAVLADTAVWFCNAAAVFRITDDMARGERARGVERADGFSNVSFPLAGAPALRTAVDTAEPVLAAGTPAEVSGILAGMFGHAETDRAGIFPVVAGRRVAGLLYAAGISNAAGLEALAQAAGAALEPRASSATPNFVSIRPVVEAEPAPAEPGLHSRAQRFARVQVAEIRLYRPEAVRTGRARANLYGELREAIDAAREGYRREFLRGAPVPDYLHLELLHTLANDDARLLGEAYPGPLA